MHNTPVIAKKTKCYGHTRRPTEKASNAAPLHTHTDTNTITTAASSLRVFVLSDKSVTHVQASKWSDGRSDKASYRVASTRLKRQE